MTLFLGGLFLGLSVGIILAAIAEAKAQERQFAAGRLRGQRDALSIVRSQLDETVYGESWRHA